MRHCRYSRKILLRSDRSLTGVCILSINALNRRPSPWLLVRTILGYGFYFASCFAFIGLVPLIMPLLAWNRRFRQHFLEELFTVFSYFLSRVYLPLMGIYTIVEESGFENSVSPKPAVFVANHRSRMDAPFLLARLRKTAVIIKSNYARQPFYATLVRHLNFISVDPNSIASLTESMQRCKRLLRNEFRLLVFPEGTRSAGRRMGEFRDLAFRMAIDADVPVVPVVVHTSLPFMAKCRGSIFPPHRFNVTLRMLSPVHHRTGEHTADFAARVRGYIDGHLRELDKGTVWESPGSEPGTPRPSRSTTIDNQEHAPAHQTKNVS